MTAATALLSRDQAKSQPDKSNKKVSSSRDRERKSKKRTDKKSLAPLNNRKAGGLLPLATTPGLAPFGNADDPLLKKKLPQLPALASESLSKTTSRGAALAPISGSVSVEENKSKKLLETASDASISVASGQELDGSLEL